MFMVPTNELAKPPRVLGAAAAGATAAELGLLAAAVAVIPFFFGRYI